MKIDGHPQRLLDFGAITNLLTRQSHCDASLHRPCLFFLAMSLAMTWDPPAMSATAILVMLGELQSLNGSERSHRKLHICYPLPRAIQIDYQQTPTNSLNLFRCQHLPPNSSFPSKVTSPKQALFTTLTPPQIIMSP